MCESRRTAQQYEGECALPNKESTRWITLNSQASFTVPLDPRMQVTRIGRDAED